MDYNQLQNYLLAGGHHSKELVEVNGAIAIGIDVVDELADLLGLGVHAKGLHCDLKTKTSSGLDEATYYRRWEGFTCVP